MQHNTTRYLKDYTPYPFHVSSIKLCFELDPQETRVSSTMQFSRVNKDKNVPLVLNGEYLQLGQITIDGQKLAASEYDYNGKILKIYKVPDKFTLVIVTIISPETNTALEGLYRSSGNYCTQCEAEGFRRITCYPDRPDVMAVFTTTIIADNSQCPVMLANGNLIEQGRLEDGRLFATWHDPFPKPCYLFALVAGNLVCIKDIFTTMTGKEVALHIYVEERNAKKCSHAMASLKKAMLWDEQRFGREYDLDIYMIVAVDDFNMGAMENKGLNVFNSKYVLAEPTTATDSDYEGIEGVIAHEYFHNWTGNRITCRDWFQLSLKEGLTVFRDQEFSADMGSRAVKRIHDVNVMRTFQFREDSGPMAHPVRPDSYEEINNFYTLTVYNKGAEVIRMIHTLLGEQGFRRGMDLYFERYDGQAVTCDDFVAAMEDASDVNLSQFKRWYSQAGTPLLVVQNTYDNKTKQLTLHFAQSCPPTPGQEEKRPFYFPVTIGLLDSQGDELEAILKNEGKTSCSSLIVKDKIQEFCFTELNEKPVVSLLRNFSAPVKVQANYSDDELAFLMAHDADSFNRWDACQQLALKYILNQISLCQKDGATVTVAEIFHTAFAHLLADQQADPAFIAAAITLPSETWIAQQMEVVDPENIFWIRASFRAQLGNRHKQRFLQLYNALASDEPYAYTIKQAAGRSLRNGCLAYLLAPEPGKCVDKQLLALGTAQYFNADNMTDVFAALAAVVNADHAAGSELLEDFYQKWKNDPLVVDKWLMLQATCSLPGTLKQVEKLLDHPAFSIKNPNKVRSLIGAFAGNQQHFHVKDGSGYAFLGKQIRVLDTLNPQIASRLVTPLTLWKRYDVNRQKLMKNELEQIASISGISRDVGEIVRKSLS